MCSLFSGETPLQFLNNNSNDACLRKQIMDLDISARLAENFHKNKNEHNWWGKFD